MTSYKKSDFSKGLRYHYLIWDIEDFASTVSFFLVLISLSIVILVCKAGMDSFFPILVLLCGIANICNISFVCFAGLLSGVKYFYFAPLVVYGIHTIFALLDVIIFLIVLALSDKAQLDVMMFLGLDTSLLYVLFFGTIIWLLFLVWFMSILHHAYEKSSDKNRNDFSSRASVGYQSSSVYSKSNFAASNAASPSQTPTNAPSQTPISSSIQQA